MLEHIAHPRRPDRDRPVLLAVDGNSLLHPQYHARKGTDRRCDDGTPTWALAGLLSALCRLAHGTQADAIVVGFDDPHTSRRADLYPEYKAGRDDKDDDLVEQLEAAPRLLSGIGLSVHIPDGAEADDVLATAARVAADSGWNCLLATSDRDAFQLIGDGTAVLRPSGSGDDYMTAAKLADKYGIRPEQYLQFAALRGDSSDNLPGVHGIGEKTAAKLLAEFDTVDDALADLDRAADVIGKAKAGKLADHADDVSRNLRLMRLDDCLELDWSYPYLPVVDEMSMVDALAGYELADLYEPVATRLALLRLDAGDTAAAVAA